MQKKKQVDIALIGEPKVGNTTIVELIDKDAKSQGTTYKIETETISYTIWELQTSSSEPQRLEIFSTSFLNQSSPFNRYVLLVSDSSEEDVNTITYSVPFLRNMFPNTRLAIIANKQDLKDRLSRRRIEKMTNLPTLELSAIHQTQRERLLNFISYLLNSESGL
jgi:GTPase involved in cell partitioning and DNA repair